MDLKDANSGLNLNCVDPNLNKTKNQDCTTDPNNINVTNALNNEAVYGPKMKTFLSNKIKKDFVLDDKKQLLLSMCDDENGLKALKNEEPKLKNKIKNKKDLLNNPKNKDLFDCETKKKVKLSSKIDFKILKNISTFVDVDGISVLKNGKLTSVNKINGTIIDKEGNVIKT